jgi:hypothetical protein
MDIVLRFSGTEARPCNYDVGLPLADLTWNVADVLVICESARFIFAWAEPGAQYEPWLSKRYGKGLPYESFWFPPGWRGDPPPVDEQPLVKFAAGSWIMTISENTQYDAGALTLVTAILTGQSALAALPGKTKYAWYNAKEEALEAKRASLEAAERLKARAGPIEVTVDPGTDGGPTAGRDDTLTV